MTYRFKLVSDEVTGFFREITIDPDASFLDLRNAILKSVDFDNNDMDSFFICNDDWEKEEEITLVDMGNSASDRDVWTMADTRISELVEDEGQKLIFVFDYLTERSFFMELKGVKYDESCPVPKCTAGSGNPPKVISLDEFEARIDAQAQSAAASDHDIFSDDESIDDYDADDLERLIGGE